MSSEGIGPKVRKGVTTPDRLDKLIREVLEPNPVFIPITPSPDPEQALADIKDMLTKIKSELAAPVVMSTGLPVHPPGSPVTEDNFVLVRMSMNMLAKLALLGEAEFGHPGRDIMGYRVVIELGEAKEGVTNNRGRREPVYTPTISIEPIPEEKPLVTMGSSEPPPMEGPVQDYTYEGALPHGVEKPK